MAHTYDVTTDIGKLRLLIGDTDITPTTDAQFSDEELQAFLDMASSDLLMAASYALEAWASTVTANMKSEKIGDYSYSRDEAKSKMDLAKKYRDEASSTPLMDIASMDLTAGSAITAEED